MTDQTTKAGAEPSGRNRRENRTRDMVAAALVAALMAATGYIAIPLGPVPVTLQIFGVVLAALLLPSEWAAAALGAYIVLGAIGIPVFAGGQAGLGVILGPTGGYIIGFAVAAPLGALVREGFRRRGAKSLDGDVAAAAVVICIVCALGWAQLAIITNMGFAKAFLVGVVPFIGPDAVKAAAAIVVAQGVRKSGVRL
jgi:biotin transport system substrate-specific component